jgi:hypothetical protein
MYLFCIETVASNFFGLIGVRKLCIAYRKNFKFDWFEILHNFGNLLFTVSGRVANISVVDLVLSALFFRIIIH